MSEIPRIHVGIEHPYVTREGRIGRITINLSGIPSTAGEGLIDEMLAPARIAGDKLAEEIRRRLGVQMSELPGREEVPTPPVDPDAFGRTAPEQPKGTFDVSRIMQPLPEPTELPSDEIKTGGTIFGVEIPFPPVEWLDEAITEGPQPNGSEGQLKALQAALGAIGIKGGDRYRACAIMLGEYGPIHGQAALTAVSSTRDLSKADAHVILSFLDAADPDDLFALQTRMDLHRITLSGDALREHIDRVAASLIGETPAPETPATEPVEPQKVEAAEEAEPDVCRHCGGDGVDPNDASSVCRKCQGTGVTEILEEPTASAPEFELSRGQREALNGCLEAIDARRSAVIFVTGKAGTGKSTILRKLRELRRLIVCAPTGLAAINVGGTTMHSLLQLGGGPVVRNKCKPMREEMAIVIERCDAIVVDEISMVRADLMDGLNWVLQKTLQNREPFGGKTIIVMGDMMQLEPVVSDKGQNSVKEFIEKRYSSPFWFDARVFRPADQATLDGDETTEPPSIERYELVDVFRQIGDPDFVDALNLIRDGDAKGLSFVNRRAGVRPEGEEPVALCFTNGKAAAINARRMDAIPGEPRVYSASVTGEFDETDLPAPMELELKIGAQVMVTKNLGGGIVNGSVGEVTGFEDDGVHVRVRGGEEAFIGVAEWKNMSYAIELDTEKVVEREAGKFCQIPLKLAWAVSVHKSQGQTLDAATIEAERSAFAHGQTYVALSRVRSMAGLFLRRKLLAEDLIVHPRIKEFFGLADTASTSIDMEAFAS